MQDENIALHRFALFTTCCTVFFIFVGGLVAFSRIARSYSDYPLLFRPATAMLALVPLQIWLGAATVWTAKAVLPATADVLTGALVLGTSFLLTLRAYAMVVHRVPVWK